MCYTVVTQKSLEILKTRMHVAVFDFLKTIQFKSTDNLSRRTIVAKLIIFFAYTIVITVTALTYIQGNKELFHSNLILLCTLVVTNLLLIRTNIHWIANTFLLLMSAGIIWATYVNEGRDNVFYWGFLCVTFMMVSFGHKKGLLIATIFYLFLYAIMFQFLNELFSFSGYVRFVVVSTMIILTSFFYEYCIANTIEQLNFVNEKLTHLTKIDSLTGLYNRRYFDEIFEAQFKIAKRSERLFVFAMIDVDFFKLYNDTYGHLSGDEVLKTIAKSIQQSLKRVDDYAFRLGGEEFGLCFSVERSDDARLLLEELRRNIENLKIVNIHNTKVPYITVSIGYHILKPYETYDRDDIYKASDDALYEAKHRGRNRIEAATAIKDEF